MEVSNESATKAFIFCALAVGIYYLFSKKEKTEVEKSIEPIKSYANASGRKYINMPDFSKVDSRKNYKATDAIISATAYINAWNKNLPQSGLDELNDTLKETMGMYIVKSETKLSVEDTDGNILLISNIK